LQINNGGDRVGPKTVQADPPDKMTHQTYNLQPFGNDSPATDFELTATVRRLNDWLSIGYTVRGPLTALSLPAPAHRSQRRDALWEKTCFEAFFGMRRAESYWEVNLSPACHWNVFRFCGYRQGKTEDPGFEALPVTVDAGEESYTLRCDIDLGIPGLSRSTVRLGLSAVLKHARGETTYWALHHPGASPDFHHREALAIRI